MIGFRTYRNGDSPALAQLWNRGLPDLAVVQPLTAHEFDALIVGKLHFDGRGLCVAEEAGRILGYAHAGFGPSSPGGPSHRLDQELGSIAMIVVDPLAQEREAEIAAGLIRETERYLTDRGAKVIYAGGRSPVDPFYWGLYGGSEFAGILDTHSSFREAVEAARYERVAFAQLLELDLSVEEPRDPRAPLLRRQARVDVVEDELPSGWWQALAIGLFRPTSFKLVERSTNRTAARAMTWDFAAGAGVCDGRSRTCIIEMEVEPERRRLGYGRFLVAEILRHARNQMADVLSVQTSSTNTPALALYQSMGFVPVGHSTLYRKPGSS